MAAITASNVTLLWDYSVGSASNKRVGSKRFFQIALTAQGGTAGDITASILGFAQIYSAQVVSFLTAGSANANIGVTIDTWAANNNIVTFAAIDGTTGIANITGTLVVEVFGNPT